MKIFLILLCVFLFITVAGTVFVLTQFDPNQFRSALEQYLGKTTGANVKLGRISIAWGIQTGLEIDGLELREPEGEKGLLLKTGKVRAEVDAKSLLNRLIAIRSFELEKPEIFLEKRKSETWNWQPPQESFKKQPAQTEQTSISPAKTDVPSELSKPKKGSQRIPWQVLISYVEIREGTLRYSDESVTPPFFLELDRFEIKVYQQNPHSPLKIEGFGSLFTEPSPNLFLNAEYTPSKNSVVFKLGYGKDTILLDGELTSLGSAPRFRGNIEIHQLNLESAIPAKLKNREYLTGILTARFSGIFDGTNPDTIKRTIAMNGVIDIRNGAFKNVNFASEVLEKITPIPGLGDLLLGQMPPELDPVLRGKDTPFEILQTKLRILKGTAYGEDILLKHTHYQLEAQGSYGILQKDADFKARIVFLDSLTDYLIHRVNEMDYLKNPQGRIVIPFVYRGLMPDATVQPDLGTIGGQLIRTQGEQLVTKGLEALNQILGEKK